MGKSAEAESVFKGSTSVDSVSIGCVISEVGCIFGLLIDVAEGVREGAKAAAVAGVVSAVPTLTAVRVFPWAIANLNYTAQALIISAASIAGYFITADKTILECARKDQECMPPPG